MCEIRKVTKEYTCHLQRMFPGRVTRTARRRRINRTTQTRKRRGSTVISLCIDCRQLHLVCPSVTGYQMRHERICHDLYSSSLCNLSTIVSFVLYLRQTALAVSTEVPPTCFVFFWLLSGQPVTRKLPSKKGKGVQE